jgi:hypothetical protein
VEHERIEPTARETVGFDCPGDQTEGLIRDEGDVASVSVEVGDLAPRKETAPSFLETDDEGVSLGNEIVWTSIGDDSARTAHRSKRVRLHLNRSHRFEVAGSVVALLSEEP